jgi:hypothetical protein
LLWIMGCNDVLGPGPDVELEVSLSHEVAVPSTNVTIWITVHNPGERDVSLGEGCPPLGFRVVDGEGRRVGPTFGWEGSFVCVGEIDATVPAGESRVYGFLWAPYYDYGSSDVPLPPGRYWIFAGFAGEPLRPPFSELITIQVAAS